MEVGAQLREPLLDDAAVRARLREERIADDAVLIGVGVGGLQRHGHICVGLVRDLFRGGRIVGRQPIQIAAEFLPRVPGVSLRQGELAHGKVGHPVADVAEGFVGAVRFLKPPEELRGGLDALRIPIELADDDGIGDDKSADQKHRDRCNSQRYGALSQERRDERRRGGFPFRRRRHPGVARHRHLKRMILIAAPRSPSLPPSFG